jgi:GTP pyrophosphokinase
VVDLPAGATPVDFAYALHTDVGHHCRGAKVNGRMVPLDYRLSNGERVEVVTTKAGGPSRDWLNPALGYIRSSRARNKVRQWFNSQDMEQTMAAGRAFVERELQREGRTDANLEALADAMGYERTEDLFAAAGREEFGARQLQIALGAEEAPARPLEEVVARKSRADRAGGILVVGVDRLMTQLAKCCKPAPPDRIMGFVTRGRGVSIHRAGCPSLAQLLARMPERAISSEWGNTDGMADRLYAVDILVRSNDRPGLLKDISEVLSREQINVTAVNTLSRQQLASMSFTLEVKGVGPLGRALGLIAEVPGVISALRC